MKKDSPQIEERAVALAERLLAESLKKTSFAEKSRMRRLARLIESPAAKQLSLTMTDQLGRSKDTTRTASLWRNLLCRFGTDQGFSTTDKALLTLGGLWSNLFPQGVMWAVNKRLEHESRFVILREEEPYLGDHLKAQAQTTQVNLNQLGEAILGEKEAQRRLDSAIQLLKRNDVDYVSVKVSAIYSQIHLVAWDHSFATIKDRLRLLYQTAIAQGGKFINLDMEAYHDLELTVAAFKEVLSEQPFTNLSAGIALQAYLPDSIEIQKDITEWAKQRCSAGGAPIKIRLVKGANLAMELVEAELHGWAPTPHRSKADSDASFKHMLEYACQSENAAAVKLGVGSHNLFDIALAIVLREKYGVEANVEIEMIQGMAPAQARAVQQQTGSLLYYTPIVRSDKFGSALAYLIRRLDENTAPGNFLASLFALRPGSETWLSEQKKFITSWQNRHEVPVQARRKTLPLHESSTFYNEPDTDWSQPRHRLALKHSSIPDAKPPIEADIDAIESLISSAYASQSNWAKTSIGERAAILRSCAYQLSKFRFGTIALLQDEGKKNPAEADSEISEAIDFARYYSRHGSLPESTTAEPLGTVVVAPPWNFPFAIPCGGVLAALMAGNTVILKPAPEVTRIGFWLAKILWKAGVPKEALYFANCSDGAIAKQLIVDERIDAVVLTGAYETAQKFQQWRPSLSLFAETSGKNATVVSALADRELAAKDIVGSAFAHSGQKCSATSLAILETEVYEDQNFLNLLEDAASSLAVGPASDLANIVTPLVQPPSDNLYRALTQLEEGESWLLKPEVSPDDPCLWSPGIKLGVNPKSWFHQTECFGPVLGIMQATDVKHAVELQNDVIYGLTAGFQSLDEQEITDWKSTVQAGNLYINRATTGAIVQRQPFGGWKASSIGPGFKAGGPNYINLFRTVVDTEAIDFDQFSQRFSQAWESHYQKPHDPSQLKCERNQLRYIPHSQLIIRLPSQAPTSYIDRLHFVADLTGVSLTISNPDEQAESQLIESLREARYLRTFETPSTRLLTAVHQAGISWCNQPFCNQPEVELPRWLKEQTISETRHRYGNILG